MHETGSAWQTPGVQESVQTASASDNATDTTVATGGENSRKPGPQEHEQPALRVMARPTDANIYGDVFGGWIMSHVDIAASVAASRRAKGRVATVAVNSFVFKQPVFIGDLVSFYATIVRTGTTSLTIDVEVFAQRLPGAQASETPEAYVKVTEATLTFVATDENRRPRPLP